MFRLLPARLASAIMAPASSRMISTRMSPMLNRVLVDKTVSPSQTKHQMQQPRRSLGSNAKSFSPAANQPGDEKPASLTNILEREIQEETSEINQRLSSDQFPGFSVETDGADVKLSKHVGDTTVTVRFTVSSSLTEWKTDAQAEHDKQSPAGEEDEEDGSYALISLPEFQVQITKGGHTLEVSCFYEDMEHDEETGEPYALEPMFNVDELVMYQGEPRESEFAVSAEYFRDDLQDGLMHYLSQHGIDEEFSKNLSNFATNYEKKQYIALLKRLKDFVSK